MHTNMKCLRYSGGEPQHGRWYYLMVVASGHMHTHACMHGSMHAQTHIFPRDSGGGNTRAKMMAFVVVKFMVTLFMSARENG